MVLDKRGRQLALALTGAAIALSACQSKTPVGPGTVTVTQTTSTTSSTTTSVEPVAVVDFTVSPNPANVGQTVFVNASQSVPIPGRHFVTYDWNWGDGRTTTGVTSSHTYDMAATYTITLMVTDSAGEKMTVTKPVSLVGMLTTTTVPATSAVAHYVAVSVPPPPPNAPADITLFLQLVNAGSSTSFQRLLAFIRPLAAPTYAITGVFGTPASGTGKVTGTFVGTASPEVNGTFTGTMTVDPGTSMCDGRGFTGTLTDASLSWTGAASPPCGSGNALSDTALGGSATLNLVRTDAAATSSTRSREMTREEGSDHRK